MQNQTAFAAVLCSPSKGLRGGVKLLWELKPEAPQSSSVQSQKMYATVLCCLCKDP